MVNFQRSIAVCFALLVFTGLNSELKAQSPPPASAVTHPYPEGDKGDLWLVGGQSNMAGFGTLKQTVPPDPRVLFYASNNEWMVARDPIENLFYPSGVVHGMVPDYTHLPVGGAGPLRPFVRSVVAVTHRPIGLIGVDAGRSMGMIWDPTLMDKAPIPPPPYVYGEMIHRVIDVGGYGHLKGMLWYQGESDAVQFPEASKVYEQQLLTFIDRVRKDTGNPDLPIIIVQLARLIYSHLPGLPGTIAGLPGILEDKNYPDLHATVTQAWEHVREVQRRAALQRPNVYVIPALDLYPMVDPIHLDFEAQQRLGPRMAEVALSKIYNVPGHGTPIRLESVELEPLPAFENGKPIQGRIRIRVRFTGVTGRLHAAGRPSGFSLRFPSISQEIINKAADAPAVPQSAPSGFPIIYTTEFDPDDPNAVLLRLTGDAETLKTQLNTQLYYGAGLDPYCNIVDDKDMALPAFGPIPLGSMGEKVSGSK